MRGLIDVKCRRKRRPVIREEDGAAEKVNEPAPLGIAIVVSGDMGPKPCSSAIHVGLECRALLVRRRLTVQPDDYLRPGQSVRIHFAPIGGRTKFEVFALGDLREELDRLAGEVRVVYFAGSRPERKDAKARLLGFGVCDCHEREYEEYSEDAAQTVRHAGSFFGFAIGIHNTGAG
jgi:hypothetical protein